jgi:hypothetical protein
VKLVNIRSLKQKHLAKPFSNFQKSAFSNLELLVQLIRRCTIRDVPENCSCFDQWMNAPAMSGIASDLKEWIFLQRIIYSLKHTFWNSKSSQEQ